MSLGARMYSNRGVEDPLMYLPRKPVVEYKRGQIVFDQDQRSDGLHLVVRGRVKVSIPLDDGAHTVLDIFSGDQFFGESGLLELPYRGERAVALEPSSLMSWTTAEIEDHVERQPRLGVGLIQMLVERCVDFEERLQTFALEKTPQRVARSLLRFSDRLGVREADGAVRIPPLTHQLISEYVGTSREIVTFQMNHLRQLGFIEYSRRAIHVRPEALRDYLNAEGERQVAAGGASLGARL